jgi:hypothetical protein
MDGNFDVVRNETYNGSKRRCRCFAYAVTGLVEENAIARTWGEFIVSKSNWGCCLRFWVYNKLRVLCQLGVI